MSYRLALDIGANSIGWCCLSLSLTDDPVGILDMGVRVFPDGRNPKDGSSLAGNRRLARSKRRNRDRYLRRRRNLLAALTRAGLMPADEASRQVVATYDPYVLRAEALSRGLAPFELGRVLFHLNQHRGFKSNRKTDNRGDNNPGVIRQAVDKLKAELTLRGFQTVGEYLAKRHKERAGVRVRLAGTGKTATYEFYPTREMVKAEFDAIVQVQSVHHPDVSAATFAELRKTIFHQRPLRSPRVGKCWLEPTEDRALRALPSVQRFRIAQDLSHLRLDEPGQPSRGLSASERRMIEAFLYKGKDRSFDQIRALLKLDRDTQFNLETIKRSGLDGSKTAKRFSDKKKGAGDGWNDLPLDIQDAAVRALADAESAEEAEGCMIVAGVPAAIARRIRDIVPEDGHASLSLKAVARILPHLEKGLRYNDAVQAAGYAHHSDQRTGQVMDRLPYYGELLFERLGTGSGEPDDPVETRYGRAPNPTVHVALNELRRVVNDLIDRHGKPSQIVVETLRELGRSKEQRREHDREQKKSQDANDARRRTLKELGLPDNPGNLMRLRLWEEQAKDIKDRCCPYSGTLITLRAALSAEIEEDHILPFALSLDNSAANRVLVTREANRAKARRTPHEAFGDTPEWPHILRRAELLPANKRWRFQPDAMERLASDGDFLARHLTDSSTIARFAKMYLEVLTPGRVWTIPGRLTSLLRGRLGLNAAWRDVVGEAPTATSGVKDRTDHRHHAVDAVVIGLIDRSLLMRVATAARKVADGATRLMEDLGEPWPGFHAEVVERLKRVVVSHKPDTAWQAALHNDSSYGIVAGAAPGAPNMVLRRPVDTLVDWKPDDLEQRIPDPPLRRKLADALSRPDAGARKAALSTLTHSGGHQVRKVRTREVLNAYHGIKDRRTGKVYRAVKLDGNHRAELWRLPNGKLVLTVVPIMLAAREALAIQRNEPLPPELKPHPAAKRLLRLHKNDYVLSGNATESRLLRVVKIRVGQVTLAPHNESGDLKARDSNKNDPFKYIYMSAKMISNCKKAHVTPSGRVIIGGH